MDEAAAHKPSSSFSSFSLFSSLPLPPGWISAIDPEGKPIYYNNRTTQTSYVHPAEDTGDIYVLIHAHGSIINVPLLSYVDKDIKGSINILGVKAGLCGIPSTRGMSNIINYINGMTEIRFNRDDFKQLAKAIDKKNYKSLMFAGRKSFITIDNVAYYLCEPKKNPDSILATLPPGWDVRYNDVYKIFIYYDPQDNPYIDHPLDRPQDDPPFKFDATSYLSNIEKSFKLEPFIKYGKSSYKIGFDINKLVANESKKYKMTVDKYYEPIKKEDIFYEATRSDIFALGLTATQVKQVIESPIIILFYKKEGVVRQIPVLDIPNATRLSDIINYVKRYCDSIELDCNTINIVDLTCSVIPVVGSDIDYVQPASSDCLTYPGGYYDEIEGGTRSTRHKVCSTRHKVRSTGHKVCSTKNKNKNKNYKTKNKKQKKHTIKRRNKHY